MKEIPPADQTSRPLSARRYRALALKICAIIAASVAALGHVAQSETSHGTAPRIPEGLLHITSPYALLVEKATQQLHLYKCNGATPELVKTYPCSTGKNRGDKTESGDLKTPEGGYFFRMVHRDEQLPSKYGVMAFVLDFPNYIDRQRGKGGNGIWLHGLDKPLLPFDTQGCVAMRNEDIADISRSIRLYDTPILITETITYSDLSRSEQERKEALQLIAAWRQAWQKKDVKHFLECYSTDLYGQGKLQQLGATKQELNQRYKFISVDLRGLNLLKHGTTVIAGFVQDYESDSFNSVGFKKLYLQKNSDALKIVGEDWVQDASVQPSHTAPSDERRIFRMLNQWVTAWERKDIESYMTWYAADFSSQNMNKRQWKEYKAARTNTTRHISIAVDTVTVSVARPSAVVTFHQRYASDTHSDYGRKTLHLRLTNGDWKIVRETWEPL